MSWDSFSKIADVIGVVSFFVAVPTYLNARRTRKAIQYHDDKKQYKTEIKTHISILRANYENIHNNDIYNDCILNDILQELDRIKINYASVVKAFNREFSKLEKRINKTIPKLSVDPGFNRTRISRQLNKIIELLDKEEKTI